MFRKTTSWKFYGITSIFMHSENAGLERNMKTYRKDQKWKMVALAFCLLALVVATAPAAMLHVTDNYGAQSTSLSVPAFFPFSLYVYADDLVGGGLTGAEFSVNIPSTPNLFFLGSTLPAGSINVSTHPEYIMGLGIIAPEPVSLLQLDFLSVGPFSDVLIELEPVTIPSIPGSMAYVDGSSNLYPFDYASGFLLNPSGAVASPEWIPEPATLSLLALGGLLIRRRK